MKIKTADLLMLGFLLWVPLLPQAFGQGTQSDKKSRTGQEGKKDTDKRLAWEKETGLKQHMMLTRITGSRRIEIHPAKQTDGIATGLVIAYGHVIPPPYRIEYQDGRLVINGVQIKPSLLLEREQGPNSPSSHGARKGHPLRATHIEDVAQELYTQKLRTESLEAVQAEILALIAKSTDVFENPKWISRDLLNVTLAGSGALLQMQFSSVARPVFNAKESRQREQEGERRARNQSLSWIKKGLELGYCEIFLSVGTQGSQRDVRELASNVNQKMADGALSREQRIEKLRDKAVRGYDFALDVVDNYNKAEWQGLTK